MQGPAWSGPIMNKNALLSKISSLSAQDVADLSSSAFYRRGYDYYIRKRVVDLQWRGAEALEAMVRGTELYRVRLTLDGGELKHTCTCPSWDPFSNCKHVLCALFTVIHLLDRNRYAQSQQQGEYRQEYYAYMDRLSQRLVLGASMGVASKRKTSRIAMIIGTSPLRELTLRCAFENDLQKKLTAWEVPDTQFSSLLSRFVEQYDSEDSAGALAFEGTVFTFVQRYVGDKAFYHESADGIIPIRCTAKRPVQQKIELAVEDGSVSVVRSLWQAGKKLARYRAGNALVFLPESGQLGVIARAPLVAQFCARFFEEDTRYATEGDVSSLSGDTDQVTVSNDRFFTHVPEVAEKDIRRLGDAVRFLNKPETYVPARVKATPLLSLEPSSEGDLMTITPRYRVRDVPWDLTSGVLREIMTVLQQDLQSIISRNKKMFLACLRVFAAAMLAPNEEKCATVIAEACAADPLLGAPAAQRLLLKVLRNMYLRVHADTTCRLICSGTGFAYIGSDLKQQVLSWSVLYVSLGHAFDVQEGMEKGQVRLPAGIFFRNAALLCSLAASQKIAVVLRDKPVELASLSVEINAREQEGSIDWFELHPEVSCNGMKLTPEQWKEILGGGFILDGDTIRIIDARSQDVMDHLRKLFSERSKRKKGRGIAVNRLQIFDWLQLRAKGIRVTLPKEYEEVISRLQDFSKVPEVRVGAHLSSIMRPYQQEGVNWLAFLYRNRFGACLADDMGVGKTLQVIALLSALKSGLIPPHKTCATVPHLIVVPPSLLFNWQHEISRFAPELTVYEYTGNLRSDSFKGADIILSTYDIIRRDAVKLSGKRFHIIVFDEAQSVKNIRAARTAAVRKLQGAFCVCLTGTPVENHIGEYYSIIDLAVPGLLGEYREFLDDNRAGDHQHTVAKTKLFVLRRTKAAVLKDLPAKIESDIYLDMDDMQKEFYTRMVSEVREEVAQAYQIRPQAQAGIAALAAILRLRQICITPALIDDTHTAISPKFSYLAEKVREIAQEGNAALIFSQFTSVLDLLEKELEKEHISFVRLDGSTPTKKRKGLVAAFQDPAGPPVFLISLKAGGFGLNLTRASYVFHLDPWWNPAVEQQAADRAHRIGQTNKVIVQRLLMHHTIEEKMMLLKERKKDLYRKLMDGTQQGTAGLSKEDIDVLLQG